MAIFRDDDVQFNTKLDVFAGVQELFDKYGVVHTIAVITDRIDERPELIEYIKNHKIDVQLHCHTHIDFTIHHNEIREQFEKGIAMIEKCFGRKPTVFYPPWNRVDQFVIDTAKEYGLEVSYKKISLSDFNGMAEGTINFHYWASEIKELDKALKKYAESRTANL